MVQNPKSMWRQRKTGRCADLFGYMLFIHAGQKNSYSLQLSTVSTLTVYCFQAENNLLETKWSSFDDIFEKVLNKYLEMYLF